MATKLDELVLELTAETGKLRAEMRNASKITEESSKQMENSVKEFTASANKDTKGFQNAISTMAGFVGGAAVIGAFNMLKNAVSGVISELKQGVQNAMAQEKALQQLANSLAISGKYTQETQKDLENFISEMERLTGVSDDVIASNMAVLSSLTRLDGEGLKEAQTAALDLSAALGVDLSTATNLVSKAVNGNVSALERHGITIEKGATKAETFSNVMGVLNDRFGGTAQGDMSTMEGVLKRLSSTYDNLVKSVTLNIVQNDVLKAILREIGAIFSELTGQATGNANAMRESLGRALLDITEVLGVAVTAADLFIRTLEAGLRTIILPINAVADSIRGIKALITGEDIEPFAATKAQFKELTDTFEKDTVLSSIEEKIAVIGYAGEQAFMNMGDAAAATQPSVKKAADAVEELSAAELKRQELLKQFADSLVEQTHQLNREYTAQAELLRARFDQEKLTTQEYFDEIAALTQEKQASELAQLQEALEQKLITEEEYLRAQKQLNENNNVELMKLEGQRTQQLRREHEARQKDLQASLMLMSNIRNSTFKDDNAVSKAAAVALATMEGYVAVQRALASAPPPANFAMASLVGAATASNVAKIAGVGLRRGIDRVPGVGFGDNFPAVLAPGERVVPAESNKDLTEFLKNQSQTQGTTYNINVMNNVPASREAGALIIEAINDAISSGSLRILGT